ncbi:MAG: hypothetical protein ACRC2T_02355, partial [Thermoguttaceae bacterium]
NQVSVDEVSGENTQSDNEFIDEHLTVCRLESAIKSPLSVRRRGKTELVAIMPKLFEQSTKVTLVPRSSRQEKSAKSNKGTENQNNHAAKSKQLNYLPRYQIYEKSPDGKFSAKLCETNSRGEFTLPYSDNDSVKMLLAKQESTLIAQFPIIQGWQSEVTVAIPDDIIRIAAESALMGIQEDAIDTAARRSILNARLKKCEEDNDTINRDKIRVEIMRLKTKEQFLDQLKLEKYNFQSTDPLVQRRIDAMFEKTTKAIKGK